MKNLSSAFGLNSDEGAILLHKFELETERETGLLDAPEEDSLDVPTNEDIDAIADQAEEAAKGVTHSKSIVFEIAGKCPAEVERILNFGLEGMGGEKLEAELPDISFSRSDSLENPTSYKLLFLDNPDPMAVQEAVLNVITNITQENDSDAPNIIIAPHFSREEGGRAFRFAQSTQLVGKRVNRSIVSPPKDENPEEWAASILEAVTQSLQPEKETPAEPEAEEVVTPPRKTISQRMKIKFSPAPKNRGKRRISRMLSLD